MRDQLTTCLLLLSLLAWSRCLLSKAVAVVLLVVLVLVLVRAAAWALHRQGQGQGLATRLQLVLRQLLLELLSTWAG
jgi:hypothetical protein